MKTTEIPRAKLFIVIEVVTDADGDYPGGDVDYRIRDVLDLAPADIIMSRPGTWDECYETVELLRKQQVAADKRAWVEKSLLEVCTDGELLAYEYAVAPCGNIYCKDDYSEEEWEEVCEMDVARFAPHSTLGRMRAFMCINAGISPV